MHSTNRQQMFQSVLKGIVVAGLFMTAAVLAFLRFGYQWALDDSWPYSFMRAIQLFIDTFARSLGTSAGAWFGRTTSERHLLVVIGFFGLLSSCIFSGMLYEQFFIEEQTLYLYNNLSDVCHHKMKIGLSSSVDILAFDSRKTDESWLL